jgi:hypothetical protein
MLSRTVHLLLVSVLAVCLLAAGGSCNRAAEPEADASLAGGAAAPAGGSAGSGGRSSDMGFGGNRAAGGQSGGAGNAGTGGVASEAGGKSTGGPGGSGRIRPDAGASSAGSSGTVVDAAAPGDGASGLEANPLACNDRTSNDRLGIYYYTGSAASTQDMQVHIDLINFTALSARLSQTSVRYWFTDEDAATPNLLTFYYTPSTVGKITTRFLPVTPPRPGADTVLEFTFTPAPDAGASFVETTEFNFAFHKDGYAGTYDQSNDYSYDPKLSKTLGANPKITAYIGGVLAWGCEPPAE